MADDARLPSILIALRARIEIIKMALAPRVNCTLSMSPVNIPATFLCKWFGSLANLYGMWNGQFLKNWCLPENEWLGHSNLHPFYLYSISCLARQAKFYPLKNSPSWVQSELEFCNAILLELMPYGVLHIWKTTRLASWNISWFWRARFRKDHGKTQNVFQDIYCSFQMTPWCLNISGSSECRAFYIRGTADLLYLLHKCHWNIAQHERHDNELPCLREKGLLKWTSWGKLYMSVGSKATSTLVQSCQSQV